MKPLPIVPDTLPALPKGYICLGLGESFERLPDGRDFKGLTHDPSMASYGWVYGTDGVWAGDGGGLYYAAPANSEIAYINGWCEKKHKCMLPKKKQTLRQQAISLAIARGYGRESRQAAAYVAGFIKGHKTKQTPA